MDFPNKAQFMENFGIEPIREDPSLSLCLYRLQSPHGDVEMEISFSGAAESFQFRLECGGREVASLVSERAERIEFYREEGGSGIRAVFTIQGVNAEAIVILEPEISCRWWVLRTE